MKLNETGIKNKVSTNSILLGLQGCSEQAMLSLEWFLDGLELFTLQGHDATSEINKVKDALKNMSSINDTLKDIYSKWEKDKLTQK